MSLLKYVHVTMMLGLLQTVTKSSCNFVTPSCHSNSTSCEFSLQLDARITMTAVMDGQGIPDAYFLPFEIGENGTAVPLQTCSTVAQHFNKSFVKEEGKRVPTGDGSYKATLLFNSSLPGPPLVVYKGQQVVVNVRNNLQNDVTSVHWHGLHMRNTPWMDGVAGLSQCGINPGETFTYRFLADTAGTYWYHTHSGTQRTMGAFGPLIVLEQNAEEENKYRGADPLPEFDSEFYMTVTDWFRKSSLEVMQLVKYEAVGYFYGFDVPQDNCFNSTKQADGVDCGVVPFESGLVNGKGRHFNRQSDEVENSNVPLEVFKVKKGRRYRFRLISAAMTFYFRVSIDNHTLNVISSDGSHVRTTQVESIIIASGERYDFWIEADKEVDNYWIRAETIEMFQDGRPIKPGHVDAILRYEGATSDDPMSSRSDCLREQPCQILNCPYQHYATDGPFQNYTCVPITALEEPMMMSTHHSDDIQEHMLNFHFTSLQSAWKTSVNGKMNVLPTSPLQLYPPKESRGVTPCTQDNCHGDLCKCTHVIEVELGKVVQLVFSITIDNPVGVLNGNSHPVHLHGQYLQVLKTGYPIYNNKTNFYEKANQDLYCSNRACNNISWTNETWAKGNVPGIIKRGAPKKDTVIVPVGGYIVTRFVADSPGYWFMHCHTEFHNVEGMSVIFKVGEESQMNTAPKNMKQCGDFHWTSDEFIASLNNVSIPDVDTDAKGVCVPDGTAGAFHVFTIVLGCSSVVLLFTTMLLLCKLYSHKPSGYNYIPSTDE